MFLPEARQRPSAIGRIEIKEDEGRDTYMVAESPEALLGLVQMGVLEVHTWGATKDRLERPDRLTFDLDPDPSVPWTQVIDATRMTKTLLEELGLVCFLKRPVERVCTLSRRSSAHKGGRR